MLTYYYLTPYVNNKVVSTVVNELRSIMFRQYVNTTDRIIIDQYYEFSLLRIFSLVIQPWMSAYIPKTDGVYMYVFGLPHLGPKKQ